MNTCVKLKYECNPLLNVYRFAILYTIESLTLRSSTSIESFSISTLAYGASGTVYTGRKVAFLCSPRAEVPFPRCWSALNPRTSVYSEARDWCCLQTLRSFPTCCRILNSVLRPLVPAKIPIQNGRRSVYFRLIFQSTHI